MDIYLLSVKVAVFIYAVASVQTEARPDRHNYAPFLSKADASMFVRKPRSVDCVSEEGSCERHPDECTREPVREVQCRKHPCPSGQVCYMTTPCPAHYRMGCKDDACTQSRPCKNGATCVTQANYYACHCAAGWSGQHCDIDLNACRSNPCQHGTCVNKINDYICINCEEDYTGRNCETDMCLLQPSGRGDFVFVIDSSVSKGNSTFEKQKQYIKDFVTKFPIGPTKFQVAIVVFSFRPEVKGYLNTHASLSGVINEIDSLRYSGGPSYTGAALKIVQQQVLTPIMGLRFGVPSYVLVLTDGLSSDIAETQIEASRLKKVGVEVITLAVGSQISQQDLLNISSSKNGIPLVFPLDSSDALYSVLKEQLPHCPDCFRNYSDVIVLFDMSSDIPPDEFYPAFETLKSLVAILPLSHTKIQLRYTTYAADVVDVFDWTHAQTLKDVMPVITGHSTRQTGPANINKALNHVNNDGFIASKGARSNARKFVVMFSQGNFNYVESVRSSVAVLKNSGVMIATVGIGFQANFANLMSIASDPALTFLVGDDLDIGNEVLKAMLGSMEFDVCEFD